MNKLAQQIVTDITVLEDVLAALKSPKEPNPMDLYVALKRADETMTQWRRNLSPMANEVFDGLVQKDATVKAWPWGDVTLTRFTPAGSWTYPPEILDMEKQLKSAKARAQQTGSASKAKTAASSNTPLFAVRFPAQQVDGDDAK